MNLKPFSIDEAHEIAEDFEDLIDTEFKNSDGIICVIDEVMVCPFHRDDQQSFAAHYHNTRNKSAALEACKSDEFDVMIFTSEAGNQSSYAWLNIRAFAEQRGISYSFPA